MGWRRWIGDGWACLALAGCSSTAATTTTATKTPPKSQVASGAGGTKKSQIECGAKKGSECATLIVHVELEGGPPMTPEEAARNPNGYPSEGQPLHITRLAASGVALSSRDTGVEHTVHVVPGRYEIAALNGNQASTLGSTTVVVGAGQEREVSLPVSVP
jgi:hypothetical protein